jgi:phospholipid/cholesterol/gamma-HCH transport system substrate-binding protein
MSTRSQKIRLGVFMLFSFLLFAGSVGTLAGLKLWNPRDRYFVRYRESISGLEIGSTVKSKGVRVGQVEKIDVSVESVLMTLTLEPGTPVTVETEAVMTSIGITGLKFIELTGGTAKSKRISPNTEKSYIKPGTGILETLTGKASDIALKMELVLNNVLHFTDDANRLRVQKLLDDIDKLAVSADSILQENKPRVKKIVASLDHSTAAVEKGANALHDVIKDNQQNLREAIAAATNAARSIDRAAAGLKPQATLGAITDAAKSVKKRIEDPNIDKTFASLNQAAARIAKLSEELSKVMHQRDRQLGTIMVNLDRASNSFKEFARSIKERPSLLLRGETYKEKDVP